MSLFKDVFGSPQPPFELGSSNFGKIDLIKQMELERMMAQSAGTPATIPPPGMTMAPETAMNMLRMRMRWQGYYKGFIYINAIVCVDKAFVMIITNDQKQVVLEDDPNLFPSDALITSLRLIAP